MTRNEFIKEYVQVAKQALYFNEIAHGYGLLELDDHINKNKVNERDIFHYGLRFAVDGTDCETINDILSNIINQEKDEYTQKLMIIKKEAVLKIREGEHNIDLQAIINSYTDLTFIEEKELGINISYENNYKPKNRETQGGEIIVARADNDNISDNPEIILLNQRIAELILNMDNCSLQRVICNLTKENLAAVLKGTDRTVKEKFYSNISKRASQMFKDIWEGRLFSIYTIINDKKLLIKIIETLADNGSIVINNLNKEGE